MKLLLDTHILIWWANGEDFPAAVADAIAAPDATVYVSIASLWEIVIKRSLGKLTFDLDFRELLERAGFILLPIEIRHLAVLEGLPPHHRDPFDRVLVAQALCDGLTFVSADRTMPRYGATLLPVHSS
ncbi:type II toxin-antitoxin system VapC family toxin [Caenispirillum bisanense]|uniref:PIN domain nuclease, a component of toxin-antitoxin system (PIN domain) n=1 Tax=Caenispirillum bisanense TaxID=414052 RepID=A0A286GFV1_9PROT|nr:type II toxin-antitoxin system VapC family toxin [Caenispirillum bisanense]SOD94009.1 PIN domain nuclease, a component of toxin-antitoxin system (PIN domain) [Caenispirillum bisanense]